MLAGVKLLYIMKIKDNINDLLKLKIDIKLLYL